MAFGQQSSFKPVSVYCSRMSSESDNLAFMLELKHTTTLLSLSDHYILSQEWRVIVDHVQTN